MNGQIILNGKSYNSSGRPSREITMAEYLALPSSKYTDGIVYYIKDVGGANQFPPLIYSDEEREVGVWRDGRPLYQRTFTGTCPNHTGQTIVQTLNEEIQAKNVSGYVEYAQGNNVFIPNYESSTWKVIFSISTVNGVSTLRIEVGSDLFNKPFYATLQYTKTTDTAGSGTWTTQGGYAHHYSTTEQVIGTWIDGKPLYERVFDLGTNVIVEYNAFTNTSIDASQMKVIIDAWGIYSTGVTKYSLMANISNNIIRLQTDRNDGNASIRYVILQYTKSTD